jgi:hypothetical protein
MVLRSERMQNGRPMNILVNVLRKLNAVPVPLVDTASQLYRARAILEANRLGVFKALEAGPLTADEVATRAGLSSEGARILLDALAASGYVKRKAGRYGNGRWVRRWIVGSRGLSGYLELQVDTWQRLQGLGHAITHGRPEVQDIHQARVAEPSEEQETYTLAMRELAGLLLPDFLKRVKMPRGARRVLDIGGAHGAYSRALVSRHPGLEATVLDLPGPIATARRLQEDTPEGISFVEGNALVDDLGSGWDVVLLVNFIHLFSPQQIRDLFQRIHEASSAGGAIVILDQFTGVSRTRDLMPSLLSLNFFNIGGRCHDVGTVRTALLDAGFERPVLRTAVPWRPSGLLQAHKPGHMAP